MKAYELMTITKTELGEDVARETGNSHKDFISTKGGKILNSDFWGKRKFSYPIESETEGFYEVISFECPATTLPILVTQLNLDNRLVRYLITESA